MSWPLPPPPVDSWSRSPNRHQEPSGPQFYGARNRSFDDNRSHYYDQPHRDYGRRSNSSYSYDERSIKRKRSVSPPLRHVRSRHDESRYRSRSPPYYNELYDGDRRPRGPPDPMTLDTMASFRTFLEWYKYTYPREYQEDEQSRAQETQDATDTPQRPIAKIKYDEYKKNFVRRQYQAMFGYHRKLAWFMDKYDTSERMEDMRVRVSKEGLDGTIDRFIIDLEAGMHDPNHERDRIIENPVTIEDAMDEYEDADDHDKRKPTATVTKTLNPGEHAVLPSTPQLMIRTIPPDIGRLRLEQVFKPLSGFKYLAIGDPVQKKQFYRAGWVAFEFEDDVKRALVDLEGKKVENFKLPLIQSTAAFVSKIRYTPAIANKPERLEKDLEQARRLAKVLEDNAKLVTAYKPLWPVGVPHDAPAGNDGVEENASIQEDENLPNRGSMAVEDRIDKLVPEIIDTDQDGNPIPHKRAALALDMYTAYLREAFHCCYYCAVATNHAEELIRKCIKHERPSEDAVESKVVEGEKSKPQKETQNEERWAENLDAKLACLIDRHGLDPVEYGGVPYDEKLHELAEPYVTKEEDSKWRCKECNKLFKAPQFVEKHVANKHTERLKEGLDEFDIYNNFIFDPQRILPMQSVPVPLTGPPQHPPQAYGLPPSWRAHERHENSRSSNGNYNNNNNHNYSEVLRPMRRAHSPNSASRNNSQNQRNDSQSSINIPYLPAVPGLPAKPVDALGTAAPFVATRMAAPLAPPAGAKPDPRARVSYHDLDQVDGTDDVALQY